jgi:hypothetical protein
VLRANRHFGLTGTSTLGTASSQTASSIAACSIGSVAEANMQLIVKLVSTPYIQPPVSTIQIQWRPEGHRRPLRSAAHYDPHHASFQAGDRGK